ncbi:hypothetical protein AAF143_04440 [Cyanobium sp. ATX-6F1]
MGPDRHRPGSGKLGGPGGGARRGGSPWGADRGGPGEGPPLLLVTDDNFNPAQRSLLGVLRPRRTAACPG